MGLDAKAFIAFRAEGERHIRPAGSPAINCGAWLASASAGANVTAQASRG